MRAAGGRRRREAIEMKKMLIVVYSWSNGNTRKIAELLQKKTGADLAVIDTVKPYPSDYDRTVMQGQYEVENGILPEIKPLDRDPADYDVIAVGSPTWWYTIAPAVKTFFAGADLTGKTLIPFTTNGGWPGHAVKDMKKAAKGAESTLEMQIRFDSTGGARMETKPEAIEEWTERVRKYLES